ncbi:prefoldin subunit [Cystobasidium minutum MCA 4210]|uniref:prefoldin subunit n=1 Tax=Cystobasidium minutum MCA 4210 TaxID=1397322 RepID=UPI0034CD2740|eukprot:jgi/Rhomi1/166068/fgenesh1_kg.1_\
MSNPAAEAQKLASEYQQIQAELQAIVETRAKLEAQHSENESVDKEFGLLTPNNTVYKLIGTALVKQDQAEAKANVKKRLEFIQGEIKKVEDQIKDIQKKSDAKRNQLVQLQLQAQEAAGQSGAPALE